MKHLDKLIRTAAAAMVELKKAQGLVIKAAERYDEQTTIAQECDGVAEALTDVISGLEDDLKYLKKKLEENATLSALATESKSKASKPTIKPPQATTRREQAIVAYLNSMPDYQREEILHLCDTDLSFDHIREIAWQFLQTPLEDWLTGVKDRGECVAEYARLHGLLALYNLELPQ